MIFYLFLGFGQSKKNTKEEKNMRKVRIDNIALQKSLEQDRRINCEIFAFGTTKNHDIVESDKNQQVCF